MCLTKFPCLCPMCSFCFPFLGYGIISLWSSICSDLEGCRVSFVPTNAPVMIKPRFLSGVVSEGRRLWGPGVVGAGGSCCCVGSVSWRQSRHTQKNSWCPSDQKEVFSDQHWEGMRTEGTEMRNRIDTL